MKNEGNIRGHSGPGVGEAVRQQGAGSTRTEGFGAGGGSAAGDLLAREVVGPAALTEHERRAFRMGVLAAGAIFIDAVKCASCRERVENLRIAIAGRLVPCDAPEFWPERGS